jgi:CRP-like cAMP-binding protein
MNETAILAWLGRVSLFKDVGEEPLSLLAKASKTLTLPCGRQVFASGEDAQNFYAIVAGEVQLYRLTLQGEEKLFQILGEGSLLAEAAMFLEPPRYPLTARISREVRLLSFPRHSLLELCDRSPRVMRRLLEALSQRLYQAVDRIEHLSLNNAAQRLVAYMLDLSPHRAENLIDSPVNILLPVPISVLAGQLAMTPETLSRQLQRFRRVGLLSGRGRELVLQDITALCNLVGLPVPTGSDGIKHEPMVGCCNLC